jgi:hypothetical protein
MRLKNFFLIFSFFKGFTRASSSKSLLTITNNNIRRNIILKELNFEKIQIPRYNYVFKITAIVFHEWSSSIDN